MERPIPYKGSEPYIFVSYAHKDASRVWPIVARLQRDGFRVWYDEGIDPGTEWDENIAAHLNNCSFFIAAMSENYLASENCRDELKYSRDLGKDRVLLYLEDVTLPGGMELRLGRAKELFADKAGRCFHGLYATKGIEVCHPGQVPKRKNSAVWQTVIAAVLVLLVGAGIFMHFRDRQKEAEPIYVDGVPFYREVLFDQDGLKVTACNLAYKPHEEYSYSEDQEFLQLTLLFENRTRYRYRSYVELSLNGRYINMGLMDYEQFELSPWETEEVVLSVRDVHLQGAGIEISKASDVFWISGHIAFETEDKKDEGYVNSYVSGPIYYYPFGAAYGEKLRYVPDADDRVLVSADAYQLICLDTYYDDENYWVSDYLLANNTSASVYAEVEVEEINGYTMKTSREISIPPNSWTKFEISSTEWANTGLNRVVMAKGNLTIFEDYYHREEDTFTYETAFSMALEENAEQLLQVRQLEPDDVILLENEYLLIALTDVFSEPNGNGAYQIYARNLSDEVLCVRQIDNGARRADMFDDSMKPGGQTLDNVWHYNGVGPLPETVEIFVECRNEQEDVLFEETITFKPNW